VLLGGRHEFMAVLEALVELVLQGIELFLQEVGMAFLTGAHLVAHPLQLLLHYLPTGVFGRVLLEFSLQALLFDEEQGGDHQEDQECGQENPGHSPDLVEGLGEFKGFIVLPWALPAAEIFSSVAPCPRLPCTAPNTVPTAMRPR